MTAGLVFGAQSATGNNASCLANTGKVLGIVTTNSMIYSPGPPELKDGVLSYKVAGLHNDFNGEVFTIYDWKTYDRLYTLSENEVWNVGGKAYAGDFIDYILNLLNQNREKC